MRKEWWTIVIVLVALLVVVASYNYITTGVLLAPKLGGVDSDDLGEKSEFGTDELVAESDFQDIRAERDNIFDTVEGFDDIDNIDREPIQKGWIIEFLDEPASHVYVSLKGLESNKLHDEIVKQKNRIKKTEDKLKKELQKISPGFIILNEFDVVFSGVAIDGIDVENVPKIENLPYVKKVTPNFEVRTTLMDSVPLIRADKVWESSLWGSTEYSCEDVTNEETCITGKGVTIGIIDTGVDYTHQDLGGCFGAGCKVIDGWDFVNNDPDPMDDMGHGTHVAATAAGRRGRLTGVAPGASIVAYKVLNENGRGYFSGIIAAIERSVDPNQNNNFSEHLDVISLSLGAYCFFEYNRDCGPDDPTSTAIDNAVAVGVVSVVAAGNAGQLGYGYISSPGVARKAVTVGASDKSDVIASFSSRGPVMGLNFGLIKPDVVAPGVDICAAQWDDWLSRLRCLDNKHISISGTSMAAPHVSGTAALMIQKNPDWTPDEIKMALRNTAVDLGYDFLTQGYGRIDALLAVLSDKPPVAILNTSGFINGTVNITGVVYADDFSSYKVEYGRGTNPTDWILLIESQTLPTNGILYENWNTEIIEDSVYNLKLTVTTITNTSSEDTTFIVLVNNPNKEFSCSSCLECNIYADIPGANIQLTENISTSSSCISVTKDDISIDCRGHTIKHEISSNSYRYPSAISSYLRNIHNKNIKITNCNIENFGDEGIALRYTDNAVILNNSLSGNGYGLYIWMSKNATLKSNSFTNNSWKGLLVYGLFDPATLNHSIDTSNLVGGLPIYYFFDIENSVIENLQSGHIQVSYGENITIKNNNVVGDGIILSDTNNSEISNNVLSNITANSGIHLGHLGILNTVKNQNYKILNNYISIVGFHGAGIVVRDYDFDNDYVRRIENNTIDVSGIHWDGMFINAYKISIIGNNVSSGSCAIKGWMEEPWIEYNFFNTGTSSVFMSCGMSFFPFGRPLNPLIRHNSIISHTGAAMIYEPRAPLELSYNGEGNFWGRMEEPYFCEAENPHPNCLYSWNSFRDDVIDSCPYNQSYPYGEWPESPICPVELLVHYKFDEIVNGMTPDSSIYGRDADVFAAGLVPGKIDGALNFSGWRGRVIVEDDPFLYFDEEMTISAWVNTRRKWKTFQTIVWKGNPDGSPGSVMSDNREFALFLAGVRDPSTGGFNSKVQLAFTPENRIGVGQFACTTDTFPIRVENWWYHVAGVIDVRNQVVKIYVDGVEVKTCNIPSVSNIRNTNGPLVVGNKMPLPAGNGTGFEGKIDDFRLYNRVLSDAEIFDLANI
ncbi:MAG: S8 family serine peptidase [Nanoarchaeota archaeon]|nr:S8 family serine peptidase [Nanoarchaeota archaeon]